MATRREIFASPKHPYTVALLSAVPVPDPGRVRDRIILKGDVPSPSNPPKGCRFHTRCPMVFDRCRIEEPELKPTTGLHLAACHLDDANRTVDAVAMTVASANAQQVVVAT